MTTVTMVMITIETVFCNSGMAHDGNVLGFHSSGFHSNRFIILKDFSGNQLQLDSRILSFHGTCML